MYLTWEFYLEYKEPMKLNCISNNPIKIGKHYSKSYHRHITKGGIQIANKHIKIGSTLLLIKVMKVKPTERYHYILE